MWFSWGQHWITKTLSMCENPSIIQVKSIILEKKLPYHRPLSTFQKYLRPLPPLSPFSIGVYQYIFVCMVFRNNTNTDEINYLITYMSLHRSLDLNSAIIAAHPSLTCAFSMAASNGRNIVRSFNVLTRLSGT